MVVTRYFGGIELGAGGLVRAMLGWLRRAPKQAFLPRVRCGPFEFSNVIYQLSEGLRPTVKMGCVYKSCSRKKSCLLCKANCAT